MCKFFSFIQDIDNKIYYFDSKLRKKLKDFSYNMDSHTSIATYFQLDEDSCNKFEVSPDFIIDQDNLKLPELITSAKKWYNKFLETDDYYDLC